MSSKTGIIGAMDVEVGIIIDNMTVTGKRTISDMTFYEGKLCGKDVVTVRCGMGKVNAGICAQTLIHVFGVDRIINTGVAGSLCSDIDIGDIVISTDAVQHDFTVVPLGFQKGEIPYTGKYSFEADADLVSLAEKTAADYCKGIKSFRGRVCTGDQFITTREQKDRIISDFGGLCCEMEGGSIAQVCYLSGIPFVIIRAVSDKPDETTFLDYKVFEKSSAENCSRLVMEMVKAL